MLFKSLVQSNVWQDTLNNFANNNNVVLISINLDGEELSLNGEQLFVYKTLKTKVEVKEIYRYFYLEIIEKIRHDVQKTMCFVDPLGIELMASALMYEKRCIGILIVPLGLTKIDEEKVRKVANQARIAISELKLYLAQTKIVDININLLSNSLSTFTSTAAKVAVELVSKEKVVAELKIFQLISKMINSTLDLKSILDYIANFMKKTLDAKLCSILIIEDEKVTKSINTELREIVGLERCNEIVVNQLFQTRQIEIIQDPSRDIRFEKLGTVPYSIMALPLIVREKLVGSIIIYSEKRIVLDKISLDLIRSVADQAATAIQNAHQHENVKVMSITDPLTKLYTRRYFMEVLKNELARAQRTNKPLSLIMFDVDYFKHYNDTNGHQAGDILLSQLGKLLLDNKRDGDIAGRYGGEEFILILPETDVIGAEAFAEKIRKAIEECNFNFQEKQPNGNLTASIGLITTLDFEIGALDVIKESDKNLYKAKRNGRNNVVSSVVIHKNLKV